MIPILNLRDLTEDQILNRDIRAEENVSAAVDATIAAVREKGDAALLEFTEKFDGVKLNSLRVSKVEIENALAQITPELEQTLRQAAANIEAFHRAQVRQDVVLCDRPGIVLGQRFTPIEKVGICVPRSPVAFPSTILMNVIPAKIAGVREIVLVTPPERDGSVSPAALAAAAIAGVDKIFKVGGAQAVAALAYGTETVPAVDKIVGPGGIFVATAKRKVFGKVGIDMIAGPSEILVLADGSCDPRWVAADLLSQAEHDVLASAVLVTDSEELAVAVQAAIEEQLPKLKRQDIARASIENNGKIIIAKSIASAIQISNEIAPEHLELCIDEPFEWLDKIKHAGSIFMGRNCPEALGDYFAGPNHTLPTSGTAKFSSPLGVDDFIKKVQYTYYTRDALSRVAEDVAAFAKAEGLTAHARSATVRMEDD